VITGKLAGREVVIFHTGMGMASAGPRVAAFLDGCAPALWIAAGFGGGLSPELKVGDIVVARNFSDCALLEAVASLPARTGCLITTKNVVETVLQKKDLGRHTGAIVVDMETASIHRLCAARGIPVLSIRAISDSALESLPVPAAVWFDPVRQRPRPFGLMLHLAARPGRVMPFARFVRGIHRAGACLTDFLLGALEVLPEK
jgi:adenosylhomocysteine nucleosidase